MNTPQTLPSLIIVFYHPSEEDIANACQFGNVYDGVVIDNSEIPTCGQTQFGRLRYISNRENLGIAEAQNIGMRVLLKEGEGDFIVFLDQDSRPSLDYPQQIVAEFLDISSTHHNLALLGPTVINKDTAETYSSVFHQVSDADAVFVSRREIISSGSCMSKTALAKVGMYDASLFIDYVDFDWCWKAYAAGYICGITRRLALSHKVGKRLVKWGPFSVIVSAPVRYYYQYRNYQWLRCRSYVPWKWKCAMGIKQALRLCYFPILIKGGWHCWKQMMRGLRDGLITK